MTEISFVKLLIEKKFNSKLSHETIYDTIVFYDENSYFIPLDIEK